MFKNKEIASMVSDWWKNGILLISIIDECNTTEYKKDVQGCIGGCKTRWLNNSLYTNITDCYMDECKVYYL